MGLQTLRSKLGTEKIGNALKIIVCALVFLYAFSVPSFGGRATYNLVMYAFMGLLTAAVAIHILLFKNKLNFKKWQIYLIPAFVIFAFVGTAIYSHSFRNWLTLVFLAASFFVLLLAFKIIDDRNIVAAILSLAIFGFAVYFIFHYRKEILNFSNYGNEGFRLGTYFDNQNAIAGVCIVGLSASLYLFLFYKTKIKYFAIIPFLAISLVGVSTGSRTFVVALAVVILTMLFFKFKKHKLLYLLVVVLLIVFAIILLNLPFAYTLKQRLERFFSTIFTNTNRVDTSAIERIVWFDYAFVLGFKNIITGYGVDGFGIYSGVGTYAHSNLPEVICDFGIIGLFIFYAPLVCLLYSSIKNKKATISYVFPIFAYYLFVSFSNVFYYNKFYYFNLAFMYYLTFYDEDKKVELVDLKEKVNHIVFTSEGMENGGAEKVIATLSNSFALEGYKVTIIGVASRVEESFYKLNEGVEYLNLHKGLDKKINGLKRIRKLHKTLKELKPDVVISFLPHVIVYTYFSMYGIKAPLIVSERNDPHLDPKGKLLRMLKKYVYMKADGCVFQTEDAKKYFFSSIQRKSVVIHNPVEVNSNEEISQNRNNIVLSVGRLTSQKNYPCLINAFEMFHQNHPDFKLKIYGDGPLKEELSTLIKSKELSDFISLMGVSSSWHADEIDAMMFVSSSDYEGMPNALAEAIYLGIPCVGTNCPIGGTKELIADGVNGYLCNINDPLDLSLKMENVLNLSINKNNVDSFRLIHEKAHISRLWLDFIKQIVEKELSK